VGVYWSEQTLRGSGVLTFGEILRLKQFSSHWKKPRLLHFIPKTFRCT